MPVCKAPGPEGLHGPWCASPEVLAIGGPLDQCPKPSQGAHRGQEAKERRQGQESTVAGPPGPATLKEEQRIGSGQEILSAPIGRLGQRLCAFPPWLPSKAAPGPTITCAFPAYLLTN